MYLGVDCGTQSTKVVVVDLERGACLGEASRPHRLDEGANGRREQWPEDWTEAFRGAFHQALDRAGVTAASVQAIGISGQQHGMVALDERGQVLYPAKLWCDTETHRENDALIHALGGSRAVLSVWDWCCRPAIPPPRSPGCAASILRCMLGSPACCCPTTISTIG